MSSRPTVYGKEIRVNSEGKCVGINLGYNFYCEHEGDTSTIVKYPSIVLHRALGILKSLGTFSHHKEIKKLNQMLKQSEKATSRWNATPFNGYVFPTYTHSLMRMVVIDNSEVRKKYNNVILKDGRYYLLSIGDGLTAEFWEKRFGSKKTMSEEDLFYMPDYQNMFKNVGYVLNSGASLSQVDSFAAAWATNSNVMTILLPAEKKSYLEDLQRALQLGNLACVCEERRMFHDRGCCLIDLEAAYLGQR